MSEPTGNPPDQRVAESEDPRRDGAGVHEFSRQQEKRNRQQCKVVGRKCKLGRHHVQRDVSDPAGHDQHQQRNKADGIRRAEAQKEQQHQTAQKYRDDHVSASSPGLPDSFRMCPTM